MNLAKLNTLWRAYPDSFAEKISLGKWKPYKHLQYISHKITPKIVNGGGRFVLEAPPRHGKSEFISHWVPTWFLDNFPHLNAIITSYEAEVAAQWGRKVRNEFESSEGLITKLRQDSKAANRFNTQEGGGLVTAGVGGPITGKGGQLIIIDDPIKNKEDAYSSKKTKMIRDWMDWVAYTRAEPGATIILLMTRWTTSDLASYLLNEHADKWEEIRMPALAEENDCLGRSVGQALCPERYTEEDLLLIKKAQPVSVWNALYQQRPTDEQGGLVKRADFKFWKVLPEFKTMIQSWDMTFKETQSGSYVVGQVWGLQGANKYLVYQIRERMDFAAALNAVESVTSKFPNAIAKLIEDKANGPAIISMLRNKITGIKDIQVKGSKYARFEAHTPEFHSGNIFIPDPSIYPWVEDYISELITFNGSPSQINDQVDATSQALDYFHVQNVPDFTDKMIPRTMKTIASSLNKGNDSW